MKFSTDINKILFENFSDEPWSNNETVSSDNDITARVSQSIKRSITETSYLFKWCQDHIGQADIILGFANFADYSEVNSDGIFKWYNKGNATFISPEAWTCIDSVDLLLGTSAEIPIRIKYDHIDSAGKKCVYSLPDFNNEQIFTHTSCKKGFPLMLHAPRATRNTSTIVPVQDIFYHNSITTPYPSHSLNMDQYPVPKWENIFKQDIEIDDSKIEWSPWQFPMKFKPNQFKRVYGNEMVLRIKIKNWGSFYDWWKCFCTLSGPNKAPTFVYFSPKCPANIFSDYPLMQGLQWTCVCCIDNPYVRFSEGFAYNSGINRLEIPYMYITPQNWTEIFSHALYGTDLKKAFYSVGTGSNCIYSRGFIEHFGNMTPNQKDIVIWNKSLAAILGTAESDTRLIRQFMEECFHIGLRNKTNRIWTI